MKPRLILTFLSLAAGDISAIAQDTTYFNKAWRVTPAPYASYYRTRIRQGALWQVTDHFLNGKPEMVGTFSDDSCHIRQGLTTWYDTSGLPFHETVYVDNKENGKDNLYYKGGQLEITGNYKSGKRDGEFTGYYLVARYPATRNSWMANRYPATSIMKTDPSIPILPTL